jgi:hypothetical protein
MSEKVYANIAVKNKMLFMDFNPKILIASFPRSGNNWTCNMVSHIFKCSIVDGFRSELTNKNGHRIVDLQDDTNLLESLTLPDWSGICKSHRFEINSDSWIIYVYRDAREVLASYRELHKLRNNTQVISKGDKAFIKKYFSFLIKHWLKAIMFKLKYPNQIVFVSYKNLHKKPIKCLNRIVKFLRLSTSDDILEKAVDACSFEKMAASPANESKNGVRFIRKGKPDGGRGEFSRLNLIQIFIISLAPYLLLRFFERIQK